MYPNAAIRVVARHLWVVSCVMLVVATAESGLAQPPVAYSVGSTTPVRLPPPAAPIRPSYPRLAPESLLEPAPSAIGDLQRELETLRSEVHALREQVQRSDASGIDRALPDVNCAEPSVHSCVNGPKACSTHFATYDDGWVLRPRDVRKTPFEIQFNIHNQFRYTGFDNSVDRFVDNAGNVTPISSRNDFDVNRGRFVFSGYAFDPNLRFYTNIDYNTVANDPMLLLLSWMSYRFSDALTVSGGLVKVPGTWEWDESSRFTLGAERTMATTFFRPSITAGLTAEGKLTDTVSYSALVGDGFNTFTLRAADLDSNLAYSALVWWEPLGPLGRGFSDLERHDSLAVRVGHGFTYASNDADPAGEPGPEQTVIRLSDGTRLVADGALAPGVTVNQFDISLYAVHLGLKYQGVSFSGEYFCRWLTSLNGTGPLPTNFIFDHGYFAQAGFFFVPKRWEVFATGSQVLGDYGNGCEAGGGVNWYAGGERGNRLTLHVQHLQDSPAQQSRTGFEAGASGALFRLQWWHFF